MTSVCVYKLCQGKLVPSLLAFMVASSQKVARQLTSIARETSKFKTSWVGRNLKDGLPPGLRSWMKAEPDLDLQPLCCADLNNPLWSQQPAWLRTGMTPGEDWSGFVHLVILEPASFWARLPQVACAWQFASPRKSMGTQKISFHFRKKKEGSVVGWGGLLQVLCCSLKVAENRRPVRFPTSSFLKGGILGQCHTQADRSFIGSSRSRVAATSGHLLHCGQRSRSLLHEGSALWSWPFLSFLHLPITAVVRLPFHSGWHLSRQKMASDSLPATTVFH